MSKNIQPVIDMLRVRHTIDNPATIEDMAAACGIDVNAAFSYREIIDMLEAVAKSPYVTRFWVGGERRYFASSTPEWHPPSERTLKDRGAWP